MEILRIEIFKKISLDFHQKRFCLKRKQIVSIMVRKSSLFPNRLRLMATTTRIGRDARTGEFIPVREAERRPSTTTVERIRRK